MKEIPSSTDASIHMFKVSPALVNDWRQSYPIDVDPETREQLMDGNGNFFRGKLDEECAAFEFELTVAEEGKNFFFFLGITHQ
jgi:hypothetical protein